MAAAGAPQLRVRGTALASLASAPSGPSWPKSVSESSNLRRPPLPWKPSGGTGSDSPEQMSVNQRSTGKGDGSLANQLRNQLSVSREGSAPGVSCVQHGCLMYPVIPGCVGGMAQIQAATLRNLGNEDNPFLLV